MKRLIILIVLIIAYSGFSQTEKLNVLSLNLDLQNQDTTKVNTSIKIVKLLYNSKDYLNALKFANESEILSSSLNYTEGLAQIKHLKGLIYYLKKDFIKASKYFKASKLLYNDLKDTINVARVNSDMAVLEIEHGKHTLGLKYALASIKTFKDEAQYTELIKTYNRLINGYESININNKAIVFSLKKLETLEALNDLDKLIKANKGLALIYIKEENYPKAIYYLERALSYNENNKTLQSDLFPIIGHIYLKKGAYKTATNYLKEGLKLNRSSNNIKGIIASLSALAEINLKHKYFKSAEKQLLEVNTLAKQIKDNPALISNYEHLVALDSIGGNFERAFTNQREYYALSNTLKNQDEDSKKTFETALLNNTLINDSLAEASTDELLITKINHGATVVSKNKFDRFRKTLYLSLIGFSILAICLIIAYFKRNKGLKYTRDLELKNKAIELQKEAILEENKHFEDINNTKDKLFSIVSHDLKDSLSSTKGLIDLLKEGSITKDEFNSLIPELSETANNASLLLFNLLNWSKSQMKSLESKPVTFDIQGVFDEKIKLIEQKLIAKNITLINESNSSLVFADKSMVEIVIQNIMTNAIKFCRSLDKITIANHIKNERLVISIADTGVGISKENISKLFGEDKSFTTTGTQNEKGTGLGLSICNDLVALNNGRIWVESILGIGSTFYIELPINKQEHSYSELVTASVKTPQPSYIEHSHHRRLQ